MANNPTVPADSQSLEQQMPDVYRQLLEARESLEKHFRDMCDIEFTIQEGRLFVLNARPGKRTPRANLRILLHLLAEGKLGIHDVVSRVKPDDVQAASTPQIQNITSLISLGAGMPASQGVGTGIIVFDSSIALTHAKMQRPYILVKDELTPEDISAVRAAQGVLTSRGGMTSHAALVCRGWSIPSVVGFSQMQISHHANSLVVPGCSTLHLGDWLTLDGTTGRVYAGKGHVSSVPWQEHPELAVLFRIISLAIRTDSVPPDVTGRIWKLWDFFVHNVPLYSPATEKRAGEARPYMSFTPPSRQTLDALSSQLTQVKSKELENSGTILLTLADTLSRLLSSALGVGNHHRYFRPLWDPSTTIRNRDGFCCTQVIGFEFFDINRHVPHLVDIATMIFVLEVQVKGEQDAWFLDFTNPRGESLVTKSRVIRAFQFRMNDGLVSDQDLPVLFHSLRRREYDWHFYEANATSHKELVAFLKTWSRGDRVDDRLLPVCYALGLLNGDRLTFSGKSLIGDSCRSDRHELA